MAEMKCVKCGCEKLVVGALHSPTRLTFRPQSAKFFTLETGDVMTRASMCSECGFVEITGDANKLRRLTSEE